jgi:hypothetical protein
MHISIRSVIPISEWSRTLRGRLTKREASTQPQAITPQASSAQIIISASEMGKDEGREVSSTVPDPSKTMLNENSLSSEDTSFELSCLIEGVQRVTFTCSYRSIKLSKAFLKTHLHNSHSKWATQAFTNWRRWSSSLSVGPSSLQMTSSVYL